MRRQNESEKRRQNQLRVLRDASSPSRELDANAND